MKLDQFLNDVLGTTDLWSKRSKHLALANMLTEAGHAVKFKTVENWFMRKSIPGEHLINIVSAASKAGREINLNSYAE